MKKETKISGPKTRSKVILLTLSFVFAFAFTAHPLPQVDNVAEGIVNISQPTATTLQIDASENAIINYSSFDIAEGEQVIVNLPSANSQVLNRVLGDNLSDLLGDLSCNGLFILVNESGIHIGQNATIDAGSIILSTRGIDNADYLSGNYVFNKLSQDRLDTLLVNEGVINISEGGFGVLIAGGIDNQGTILAPVGKVALAGGDMVRLGLSADGLISVAIEEEVASTIYDLDGNPITTQISNTGHIGAGVVAIQAQSLPGIFEKAINLEGTITADDIQISSSGTIRLGSTVVSKNIDIGSESAPAQSIEISGAVSASENLIAYAQDYIQVSSSIEAANMTLQAQNAIDTTNAVVISATSLNLISNRFGSNSTPLNLNASNLHINRLSGSINILQSLGIGTSIQLRGPPEFGSIQYNNDSNVILEAENTILSGDGSIYLYSNITFYNLNLTTPDFEIYFQEGKTYTFKGNLTILGSPDQGVEEYYIKFRSQVQGQQYYLNIESSNPDLNRINIQDASSLNYLFIPIGVDLGNNSNIEVDPIWDGGG